MRVKDIRQMLKAYKPDDELVIGWWDREWFDGFSNAESVLEYVGLGDLMMGAMDQAGVKRK